MLSRGKVTPATVSYYTAEVARGLEDYYAGRGESPGHWVSQGSAAEGLAGEVAEEELARLFRGCHPRTGEFLGAAYKTRPGVDRVTGWDLTFSSPKSVSVLWAVGGGEVGMAVAESHHAAVHAGLAYLEDHAAFSRTGKAGIRQVDTEGLLAAAFVHRSSRAGDPQLHTHVLVSGRLRCPDGQWRALDSRALHRQLKPAGMVYQAALRAELSSRLGLAWNPVDRHGQAEVIGVPTKLCKRFSTRRAAVEARASQRIAKSETELGRSLSPQERRRAYEAATLETRTAKDHGAETDAGLHDRWTGEAMTAGFDPQAWVPDVVHRLPEPDLERVGVVDDVLKELGTTSSTWRRTTVVGALARRCPPSLPDAQTARRWIEDTAEVVLADPRVCALTPRDLDAPAELRRRDGASVYDRHGAPRFATLATLGREQQVLDLVEAGRGASRSLARPEAVDEALRGAALGPDQAEVVRALTLGGEAVACVVGPAGTGKSRTMGAAARAWTASGVPVRGLAVSAVAAGVLGSEAGIPTDTVAKLLFEHDRPGGPGAWALRRDEVVVVDEAGTVASAELARLVALADTAGAKVVLVGDYAQLGAVQAGGLFRLLADQGATELTGVRRFHEPWEAEASLRLRARDPSALALYQAHGRIGGGDRLAVADEAFEAWQEARRTGESVAICAPDHATVEGLCRRIRAARVAAGEVEPGGVSISEQTVGVGDEVVTTRNDRRLGTTSGHWVRNGDRWAVQARHPGGSLTVSHLGGHGRAVLPADYVANELALAYALTVHKAQGLTVDRAVVIVDDRTTAEALYVGLTRGRATNTALAVTDTLEAEHAGPQLPSPVDIVARALGRVAGEEAALAVLGQARDRAESLATLAPRLANLQAWIQRATPPDPSADLQRLAQRRAHFDRHGRPGMLTRSGRDHRRTLRQLEDSQGSLDAAGQRRSTWFDEHADVLAYRDELAQAVETRRLSLGLRAAAARPRHLVELLGPVPAGAEAAARWARMAGHVESYREQWGVEPEDVRRPPVDGVQYRDWSASIRSAEMMRRLDAPVREITLTRSRGVELS